jgi:hypothetical protein
MMENNNPILQQKSTCMRALGLDYIYIPFSILFELFQ